MAMLLTLYHGTDGTNAESILRNGLRPSANGRLGAGVYLTDDREIALSVARSQMWGNKHRFVITAQVDLGAVQDYGEGGTDAAWRTHYDSAMAIHPPWPGVCSDNFQEYCVASPGRVEITHVEGIVAQARGGHHFVVNVGHQKFLDSHGQSAQMWGNGRDKGNYPNNLTWEFRPCVGTTDVYYIAHKPSGKYLDTWGDDVKLWRGDNAVDVGAMPENIQWRLRPVGGVPDTFYIINVGHNMFLDSPNGHHLQVWGNGVL